MSTAETIPVEPEQLLEPHERDWLERIEAFDYPITSPDFNGLPIDEFDDIRLVSDGTFHDELGYFQVGVGEDDEDVRMPVPDQLAEAYKTYSDPEKYRGLEAQSDTFRQVIAGEFDDPQAAELVKEMLQEYRDIGNEVNEHYAKILLKVRAQKALDFVEHLYEKYGMEPQTPDLPEPEEAKAPQPAPDRRLHSAKSKLQRRARRRLAAVPDTLSDEDAAAIAAFDAAVEQVDGTGLDTASDDGNDDDETAETLPTPPPAAQEQTTAAREMLEPVIPLTATQRLLGRLATAFGRGDKKTTEATAEPDDNIRIGLQTRILLAGGRIEDWLTKERQTDDGIVIETNKRRLALLAGGVALAGIGIYAVVGLSLGSGARAGLEAAQPGTGVGSGNVAAPDSLPIPDSAPTGPTVSEVVPQSAPSGGHDIVMQSPVHGKADTVWSEIHKQYHTTSNRQTAEILADYRKANPGVNLDHVKIGQTIHAPQHLSTDSLAQSATSGSGNVTAEQMNSKVALPEFNAATHAGTFDQTVLDQIHGHGINLSSDQFQQIIPSLRDYHLSVKQGLGETIRPWDQMRAGEPVYLPPSFEEFIRVQMSMLEELARNEVTKQATKQAVKKAIKS